MIDTWKDGDLITADRLNNQELGFQQIIEKKKNLLKQSSEWSGFGKASDLSESNDWYSANLSTSNDGILTSSFDSNSDSVNSTVSCKITGINTISLYLGYLVDGAWSYDWKTSAKAADDGSVSLSLTFDATYYAAHKNATKFRLLLTNLGSTSGFSGTLSIDDISVSEADIENTDIYDPTLVGVIKNIGGKISKLEENNQSVGSDTIVLGDKDGTKRKLQVGADGILQFVPTIPEHYIVLGNSITVGITDKPSGYFGMCASSPTKDWAHVLDAEVLSHNASATHTTLDIVPLESATTQNDYDTYFSNIKGALRATTNLIIIQAGDNVNTSDRLNNFKIIFPQFLNSIRTSCPNARVVVVGTWFNSSSVLPVIKPISLKYGAEFITINDLNTTANQAVTGQTITYTDGSESIAPDGWITHPGDNGHFEIAKRVIEELNF